MKNEFTVPDDEYDNKSFVDEGDNKEVVFENNDKIIIRNPKHSEYKFMNALFKIIIGIIKFFSLCFGSFVAFMLVCLFISFIGSFLLYKTGLFFIGLLIAILSASAIGIIILLLILNFVFNRKNNKINYLKKIAEEEEKRNGYQSRIDELEQQNFDLQQKIYDLQAQLEN